MHLLQDLGNGFVKTKERSKEEWQSVVGLENWRKLNKKEIVVFNGFPLKHPSPEVPAIPVFLPREVDHTHTITWNSVGYYNTVLIWSSS